MKKRILMFIVIVGVLFILVGCGKGNEASTKATIINMEGKEENYTSRELCDINTENSAKFKKYYEGSKISFVGTISKIDSYFKEASGSQIWDSITFDEGWILYLPYGVYDIADLNKNDVLFVSSNIYSGFSCGGNQIDVRGTGVGGGYSTTTLKSTVVKDVTGKDNSYIDNIKKIVAEENKLQEIMQNMEDKLEFISKYAGNTNYKGSRKFDDGFMNQFKESIDGNVDLDLLEKSHNNIKDDINTIKANSQEIYDLVIDMGKTNSNKNVSKIKTDAKENLKLISELYKELRRIK